MATPGVIHIKIDMRPLRRAIAALAEFSKKPAVQQMIRHEADLKEIRAIAAREKAEALEWLDERVQQSYDDLGIDRYEWPYDREWHAAVDEFDAAWHAKLDQVLADRSEANDD